MKQSVDFMETIQLGFPRKYKNIIIHRYNIHSNNDSYIYNIKY